MRLLLFFLTCELCLLRPLAYGQVVLPFKFYDDRNVLLELPSPDGAGKLTFFFDTGASATLLDQQVAQRLPLRPDMQQRVPGASGERVYALVSDQTLPVAPGLTLPHVNLVLEDLTKLNGSVGQPFDGIIGHDILKNYLTVLDYDQRQLRLYPFGHPLDLTAYTPLDFTFANGIPIPQLPLSLQLLNGQEFTGNVLFDSGAGLSLLLSTPFQQQHGLLRQVGRTVTSTQQNLSGQTTTTFALVQRLALGPYAFQGRLPVNIATDRAGGSAYEGYLGILGSDVISRFTVVLDYAAHKLYLQPNRRYRQPFVTAISPLRLSCLHGVVTVASVREDTLAYRCSLRAGQVIVALNGLATPDVYQYRRLLLEDRKQVTVIYRDAAGKEQTCQFRLEPAL